MDNCPQHPGFGQWREGQPCDCRDTLEPELTVKTARSLVRLRWRTRLHLWWIRRRLSIELQDMLDEINAQLEDAFINGR